MKSPKFNAAALPPIEQAARQEYEYFGSTLTTNTALKIALFCAFVVIGILSWNTVRLSRVAANVKPLIIRINEVGRAEAIAYQDFAYKPQAPEIRYFLTTFVTGYYSRNHKTVAQQYVNSLYFLDRSLFAAIDARDRRTEWRNDCNQVVRARLEKQAPRQSRSAKDPHGPIAMQVPTHTRV
jgi:type IV secretion system protein VirB5